MASGFVYFVVVFGAGFALGAIRVLLLVPLVGELWAGLIELPVILSICWVVSKWVVRRFRVAPAVGARLRTGLTAFGFLIVAEAVLGLTLFGMSMTEFVARWGTLAGGLGLAGQFLFGLMPTLQLWTGTQPSQVDRQVEG